MLLQVDLAALCKDLAWSRLCLVEVTPGEALWAHRSKQQRHTWGTPEWAQSTAAAQDAISDAIADHLDIEAGCKPYLACVWALQQAFAMDTDMQLSRFQTLQNKILSNVLPHTDWAGLD